MILPTPLLYLRAFFEATRQDYYARLAAVTDDAAWEERLVYFLNAVARMSEHALGRAIERLEAKGIVQQVGEAQRIDPAVQKVYQRKFEERRAAHAAELSRLRRVLLYTFPDESPQAVSLVNVTTCELTTWIGAELKDLPSQLARFDLIRAIGVRQLLRELAFDPGERHLAELGPPKQSHRLNRSCAISCVQRSNAVWRWMWSRAGHPPGRTLGRGAGCYAMTPRETTKRVW
ncbi:MAG: hypothetical protein KAY24_07560 [Candidatus Eisenbacteria sp.]|nr:hypothetical protein [Candidatus Eisenbacteria bacterium]